MKRDDNESISLMLNKLRDSIFNFVKKRVGDKEDAEDITQEALFRLSKQFPRRNENFLTTEEDIIKYSNIVTKNEIYRFYKNAPKKIDINDEELNLLEANILNSEMGLIILQNLAKLPTKQRIIYFLQDKSLFTIFLSHFSKSTIAATLELSEKDLEHLLNKIPLSDVEIKEVIEILTKKELKSSVRDERYKGKNFLKKLLMRTFL